MADVLNPQMTDAQTTVNAKVLMDAPIIAQNAAIQGFTLAMDMLNKAAVFNFNKQMDMANTTSPEEAVATQLTAGAGLANKIEDLNATVANNAAQMGSLIALMQQFMKGAGVTPPVTVSSPSTAA